MSEAFHQFTHQSFKELRRTEQWDTIIAEAKKLMQNNTLPILAAAEWAFALAKTGKGAEADRMAIQVLQAAPTCLLAMRTRILVLLQARQLQEALLLAQSLFRPPFVQDDAEETSNCVLLLAIIHKESDEIEKAFKFGTEAQQIFPTANGHAFLGFLAFQQRDFQQAEKHLSKSLKIKSAPKIWHLLAELYHQQNRIDDMVQTYKQASRACPDHESFWIKLGELYCKLHRYDEALHCLRSELEKHPQSAAGWLALAKIYLAQNCARECEKALRAAVRISPNNAEIIYNLALHFTKTGKDQEAFILLQEAYNIDPKKDHIALAYALSCEVNSTPDMADTLFAQVIARNPHAPSVLKCRANFCMMRSQYDEALRLMQQALTNELWFLKQQSSLSLFGDGARPPMDVYDASETLIAVCHFLERLQVPYFLSVGTLLGIIRDGNLLPHDKDTDLGIPWDVDREWLLTQLEESEEFAINGARPEPERAEWNFSVVRKGTPIAVDFFFHKPDGDDWLMGFNATPTPWLIRFKQRKLTTVEYRGHLLPIPENPEGYLEEVYGPDWRIPMPSYDTVIAASNLCPETYLSTKIIGYNRLYEALMNRTWKKVLWYCEALKRFDNPPILDELAGWLRDAMPQKSDKVL